MTKPSDKPFRIRRPTTWLSRPGQVAETSPGTGRRFIVHRWSDTGETRLRDVKGDGRTADFTTFAEWNLGVTASIEDAVTAADAVRADPDSTTPDWSFTPHRWVRIDGPATWRTCELCGTGPNASIHRNLPA